MPDGPRFDPDTAWIGDVRVQPLDFTAILPSGILIGSVNLSVVDSAGAAVSAAVVPRGYAIRTGSKIVDIVYQGTVANSYTVIAQAVGSGAIAGLTWQQTVKGAVTIK